MACDDETHSSDHLARGRDQMAATCEHDSCASKRGARTCEHDGETARARKADAQLSKAHIDLAALEKAPQLLDEAWATMKELVGYYETTWMNDVDALNHEPCDRLGVLAEDAIWDAMTDFERAVANVQETAQRILGEYRSQA